jgi:predicted phosphodiesterase
MKSSSLLLEREKNKNSVLASENLELKKQLALAVSQLESARRARAPKIPVVRPRYRLKGDEIRVIIPDTHGSCVDRPALAAVMADVRELNPASVILLGDHVDCGGFLAQHHVVGYTAETKYSYEDDICAANSFLDQLRAEAPDARIEYLEGNHEDRVEGWILTTVLRHRQDAEFLRRQFAPQYLLRLAEREIPYYRRSECYDGVTLPGVIKRGKCYFLHGFSTSKHATAAVQTRIAGNVVFGHTHRHQSDVLRRVSTGTVGSWNPGCLCNLQPLWQHGNPTEWTHGYAIQITTHTGAFLHLNVPIVDGVSLLTSLFKN